MCGRFVRKISMREAADFFKAEAIEALLEPSYNIAPSQPIAVIMEEGKRTIVSMKWGLIPSWAKDPKIGYKMINARSETVLEKPSFKNAFHRRRCLIIADGFYEWKSEGKGKTPVYIYLKDYAPFAMAGLYESWKSETGETIKSCTIITTAANEFMKAIHHRMPVILDKKDHDLWLNPESDEQALVDLLKPFDSSRMASHTVSTSVNSPFHNGPDCIIPG